MVRLNVRNYALNFGKNLCVVVQKHERAARFARNRRAEERPPVANRVPGTAAKTDLGGVRAHLVGLKAELKLFVAGRGQRADAHAVRVQHRHRERKGVFAAVVRAAEQAGALRGVAKVVGQHDKAVLVLDVRDVAGEAPAVRRRRLVDQDLPVRRALPPRRPVRHARALWRVLCCGRKQPVLAKSRAKYAVRARAGLRVCVQGLEHKRPSQSRERGNARLPRPVRKQVARVRDAAALRRVQGLRAQAVRACVHTEAVIQPRVCLSVRVVDDQARVTHDKHGASRHRCHVVRALVGRRLCVRVCQQRVCVCPLLVARAQARKLHVAPFVVARDKLVRVGQHAHDVGAGLDIGLLRFVAQNVAGGGFHHEGEARGGRRRFRDHGDAGKRKPGDALLAGTAQVCEVALAQHIVHARVVVRRHDPVHRALVLPKHRVQSRSHVLAVHAGHAVAHKKYVV